jgi:Reverse transcriptase (RNA-dependent DNA polymerase)
MPENWEKATIIPILKSGDATDCNNYRGISLLDVVYKIFATWLKRRLDERVETQLGEYQAGFRKGRGTTDQIFTIKK